MRSDVKIIKGLKDWSPDAAGLIPRGVAAARKMDGAVPEETSGDAKRYIAVFDVKYQNSTSKVTEIRNGIIPINCYSICFC